MNSPDLIPPDAHAAFLVGLGKAIREIHSSFLPDKDIESLLSKIQETLDHTFEELPDECRRHQNQVRYWYVLLHHSVLKKKIDWPPDPPASIN